MKSFNLKDKHLRYGGYGATLTLLVIAICIVFNILITHLDIKLDVTDEQFYTLSPTTLSVLKEIKDPTSIYVLEKTGAETHLLKEILNQYTKRNKNLKLIYKDPVLYPTFASSYLDKTTQNISSVQPGSIIIENTVNHKVKIVEPKEFVNASKEEEQSIYVENAVSSALNYTIHPMDGFIYYTIQHNELPLPNELAQTLDQLNLRYEPIDLTKEELSNPVETTLMIISPHTDFSKDEVTKIIDFLHQGGKAFILLDADLPELPELNHLLTYYGLTHEKGVVIEDDFEYMSPTSPTYLMPKRGNHKILEDLSSDKAPLIIPISSALKEVDSMRNSLSLSPLLSTSRSSFLRKNIENHSLEKAAEDISGPFIIAAAIEDKGAKPSPSKLVVVGNSYFTGNSIIDISSTCNSKFIQSTFNFLYSIKNPINIEGKSELDYKLRPISSKEMLLYEGFIIVVMPSIIIVLGIIMWLRRRHL